MTTTGIRKLIETTAADLHDEGVIDAKERTAIANINGHQGATVEKY